MILKRAGIAATVVALAVGANGHGELPSEFRIFTKGWNDTKKGRFLFDDEAAAAVLAAHEEWGVDFMIDLEHQSLVEDIAPDPTAKDARGWCSIELRDGELWAVNVTWTPDGEARLREKRQRYISPAFDYDKESRRIAGIFNIAITATPATHDTPALVAASAKFARRKLSSGRAVNDVQRAVQAALDTKFPAPSGDMCGPRPYVMDLFAESVVYELDGKLFEVGFTFDGSTAVLDAAPVEVMRAYQPVQAPAAPPPAGDASPAPTPAPAPSPAPAAPATTANRATTRLAAEGDRMDTKLMGPAMEAVKKGDGKAALEILEGLIVNAAGGGAPAPDAPADKPADPPPKKDDAPAPDDKPAKAAADPAEDTKTTDEEARAAARAAMALTGKTNATEAMAELARRTLAPEPSSTPAPAPAPDADAVERRGLVAELVKLRVELPATAWSDEKGSVPCKRLQDEPIVQLRSRVALYSQALGRSRSEPKPPTDTDHGELTPQELEMCAAKKYDPAKYAATRAAIRARSNHGS